MNAYKEMMKQHQQEINNLPLFFAFGIEQFREKMKQRGLKETDVDKIYNLGSGGYFLRSDEELVHNTFSKHHKELNDAIKSNKNNFVYDMFRYELGNHEYIVSMDISETLYSCGLSLRDVNNNPALKKELKRAIKDVIAWHEANN